METKQKEDVLVKNSDEVKVEARRSLKNGVDFIDEAFGVYRRHYKTLLSISLVSLIPSILVSFFTEGAVLSSVVKTLGLYLTILCGAIIFILFAVISSWAQIALIYFTKERDKDLRSSQAFAFAWEKLGTYWWIAFLVGFLFLGGFMLFFIPGLLFSVWFSFVYYVMVAEDEKGMTALLKSREYVKGRVWSVVWRFIVLYFFNLLFAIPVGLFFGGFSSPLGSFLTQNIFSFFVVPFNIIYLFLVYQNLVEIKGKFVFAPHKNTKRIFLSIGAVGILLPSILIGLFVLFFPVQSSQIFLMMSSV